MLYRVAGMNLPNYLKAQPFIVWNIGHENRVCVTYCNTRVNFSLLESVSQRFRRSARWKQAAAHTQCSSVSIVAARRRAAATATAAISYKGCALCQFVRSSLHCRAATTPEATGPSQMLLLLLL